MIPLFSVLNLHVNTTQTDFMFVFVPPLHVLRGGFWVHVCKNLASAGLCMLDWSDGPPIELRRVGFTIPDRWEGIVLRRKWQNKVLSATHSFSSLTLSLSQLLFPSVSFFRFPILSQFLKLAQLKLAVFQPLSGSS